MTPNAAAIIDEVIETEGGLKLINVKNDRGKQTYAGISRRFWPNWDGWKLVDRGILPSQEMVSEFYHQNFWQRMNLDLIESAEKAEIIMDCGVLFGAIKSVMWAQLASGALADGQLGPKTASAVNGMDQELFSARMALTRIADHTSTVIEDRSQIKFYLGWVSRALDRSGIKWR